jgi:hypothetical protein
MRCIRGAVRYSSFLRKRKRKKSEIPSFHLRKSYHATLCNYNIIADRIKSINCRNEIKKGHDFFSFLFLKKKKEKNIEKRKRKKKRSPSFCL